MAEQDFHKEICVEFRAISVESNCVHHILRSERISFIWVRTLARFLTRTPCTGPSSSSSSFSASVASSSSPIWTNCRPNLYKGTCLASKRRAKSIIAGLGSSAGPVISSYSRGKGTNRLLTGPTVRDDEDTDGLVVGGRLLNPRHVDIHDLP